MKKKLSKKEQESLKKILALPEKEFEKELFTALDVEKFFGDEKNLQAHRKKYRKQIKKIEKGIDINKIIMQVNAYHAGKKN